MLYIKFIFYVGITVKNSIKNKISYIFLTFVYIFYSKSFDFYCFLKTYLKEFKIILSHKIGLYELYNFVVHQIYMLQLNHLERFNFKILANNFPYIQIHFYSKRFDFYGLLKTYSINLKIIFTGKIGLI